MWPAAPGSDRRTGPVRDDWQPGDIAASSFNGRIYTLFLLAVHDRVCRRPVECITGYCFPGNGDTWEGGETRHALHFAGFATDGMLAVLVLTAIATTAGTDSGGPQFAAWPGQMEYRAATQLRQRRPRERGSKYRHFRVDGENSGSLCAAIIRVVFPHTCTDAVPQAAATTRDSPHVCQKISVAARQLSP